MAWFKNHYRCGACGNAWTCEGASAFDDNCPDCGARAIKPSHSDDVSFLIVARGGGHTILRSRASAAGRPDYVEVAEFARRDRAEECLAFLSASPMAGRP